jgi:predicted lipoprotein with Yx(FWY)xxD motif
VARAVRVHRMTRSRLPALALTAATGLVFLVGCTGSGPVRTDPAGPAAVKLTATTVGGLGTVVTDADGMTLYRFDQDRNAPSATNCTGTCTIAWPPVLATSAALQLSGVDRSVVGTVTRPDGNRQITISGWPVYRFAQDTAPGQANGQGMSGTWFAVTPQGSRAAGQPPGAVLDSGY